MQTISCGEICFFPSFTPKKNKSRQKPKKNLFDKTNEKMKKNEQWQQYKTNRIMKSISIFFCCRLVWVKICICVRWSENTMQSLCTENIWQYPKTFDKTKRNYLTDSTAQSTAFSLLSPILLSFIFSLKCVMPFTGRFHITALQQKNWRNWVKRV